MQVYRIAKEAYIRDLSGIGAKTVGGRWNFKGVAVLYTSSSVSLSMLECLAHFPPAFAPKNMSMATINIPDDSVCEFKISDMPNNWQGVPSPRQLKEMAHQWIKAQEFLILKVPSIIVPNESNYIINPFHTAFSKVTLVEVSPFSFDTRVL